jgi:indole-3-glycerol phosphate synthase
MNRLDEIIANKRVEVERLRSLHADWLHRAGERTDYRSLHAALQRRDGKPAIIAEVKKASPSAGVIAETFHPEETAKGYEGSGAAAISVLTDERFFQGSLQDLTAVRCAVSIPVLRKDFILDEIQIVESIAAGADAILLIVAALPSEDLLRLQQAAANTQLDVLTEVHTAEELQRALDSGAKIIGINNRDLATFQVDIAVTERLSELVPDEVLLVSESGFKTPEDVARVHRCGVDAVLIGESLMRGELSIEQLRQI